MIINDKKQITYLNFSEVAIVDSLMVYYPFDSNANDYSGNNYHATVSGATLSNGVKKNAYNFNGINNYIQTPYLPATSQFSISIWFKTSSTGGGERLYWGTGTNKVILDLAIGSKLEWYIQTSTSTLGYIVSNLTYNINSWNHAVLIYDGNKVNLYINGVLDTSTGSITGNSIAGAINLGTNYNQSSNWYYGLMDEFRFYSRALSNEEISILYEMTSPNTATMKITKDTVYLKDELKEVI